MSFTLNSIFERLPSLHSNPQTSQLIWISAGTVLTLGSIWTINDKHQWQSFGTGGTKPTWFGYIRNNIFLRTVLAIRGGSLTSPDTLDSTTGLSYLSGELPQNPRSRPKGHGWTLPQRQKAVPIDDDARDRLWQLTQKYAAAHADVLDHELSNAEGKTTLALYAKPGLESRPASAKDKILDSEIAHVHPEENSLHVWLSEADAAEVIRKGWGEKFCLAPLKIVHPGFVFVYAPESARDVEVIERIVEAGISYVTGKVL